MTEDTTVRITISRHDEARFLERLGVTPRDRNPKGTSVELLFDWFHPVCHEFHFDGIPFTGFHSAGDGFEPHRMCGSGDACEEIYADDEGHLYYIIDEATGQPNSHSRRAVREFLGFDRECRARVNARLASVG